MDSLRSVLIGLPPACDEQYSASDDGRFSNRASTSSQMGGASGDGGGRSLNADDAAGHLGLHA